MIDISTFNWLLALEAFHIMLVHLKITILNSYFYFYDNKLNKIT